MHSLVSATVSRFGAAVRVVPTSSTPSTGRRDVGADRWKRREPFRNPLLPDRP